MNLDRHILTATLHQIFHRRIFHTYKHIWKFVPVQGLLEYAKKLGFGPILVQWLSNLWGGFATLRFVLYLKNCIFWGASFEPIETLATLFLKTLKLQGFHQTHLYGHTTDGHVCFKRDHQSYDHDVMQIN